MGIPDHLTCLLRNLYAGQEATVRTGHGTIDWFQIGKGVCQGFIFMVDTKLSISEYTMAHCSPYVYFNTKDEFQMTHLKFMTRALS